MADMVRTGNVTIHPKTIDNINTVRGRLDGRESPFDGIIKDFTERFPNVEIAYADKTPGKERENA